MDNTTDARNKKCWEKSKEKGTISSQDNFVPSHISDFSTKAKMDATLLSFPPGSALPHSLFNP